MQLSTAPRRWLLSLHLLFVAILFGTMVVFLILSITAAATQDETILKGAYTAMYVLATSSVRASTIGSVVTGILLSVWTKWGLFTFYWIIFKEILTVVAIGLAFIGMSVWTLQTFSIAATEGLNALDSPVFITNRLQLFIGIILQIVSLGAMIIVSVFKPWGRREHELKY
ncbi:hypothetical protein [Salibacterium sp. K-3]